MLREYRQTPSQNLSRNQQSTITDPRPRGRRNIFRRLKAATGTRTAIYFPQVQTVAGNVAPRAGMEIRKPLSKILASAFRIQERKGSPES